MTVRNQGAFYACFQSPVAIRSTVVNSSILTDESNRSRLFAEQVPQGSLLCPLLRAPRSHVRFPLQGAP